jgi:hypothetical protein
VDVVVTVVHCHTGTIHTHVRARRIPQGRRSHRHWWLSYAPSATNSFSLLDICNSPVEYDVSYAYNIKERQLHLQKVTSISIHHLIIIQWLHESYMTLEQVAEMKPAYQK